MIHALVGELPGDYERQERLDMFAEFIGRPLDTSNDLSLAEASTVIDRLQELAELGR